MTKRVEFLIRFAVDLDMVPGWGHQSEDWRELIKRNLLINSHYNPSVEFIEEKVTETVPRSTEELRNAIWAFIENFPEIGADESLQGSEAVDRLGQAIPALKERLIQSYKS